MLVIIKLNTIYSKKVHTASYCIDSLCLASLTNSQRSILGRYEYFFILDFDCMNIHFHFKLLSLIFIISLYILFVALAFVVFFVCFCK